MTSLTFTEKMTSVISSAALKLLVNNYWCHDFWEIIKVILDRFVNKLSSHFSFPLKEQFLITSFFPFVSRMTSFYSPGSQFSVPMLLESGVLFTSAMRLQQCLLSSLCHFNIPPLPPPSPTTHTHPHSLTHLHSYPSPWVKSQGSEVITPAQTSASVQIIGEVKV